MINSEGSTNNKVQESIDLASFAGPLALLDYLLTEFTLPLTEVSIAEICDYYLAIIDLKKSEELELASEFIVVAAQIIQLKSRLLLPYGEAEDDAEESGPPLLFQLMAYRRNRELASELIRREERFACLFRELSPSPESLGLPPEVKKYRFDKEAFLSGIESLKARFSRPFDQVEKKFGEIVRREPYSVKRKLKEIRESLKTHDSVYFSELLNDPRNIAEQLACFLAILELIRQGEIVAKQKAAFSPIRVEVNNLHVCR